MKKILFFLIILALAVWLGLKITADPGYAIFSYAGYSVEMTLWAAVLIIFITLIIFYMLLRWIKCFFSFTTAYSTMVTKT